MYVVLSCWKDTWYVTLRIFAPCATLRHTNSRMFLTTSFCIPHFTRIRGTSCKKRKMSVYKPRNREKAASIQGAKKKREVVHKAEHISRFVWRRKLSAASQSPILINSSSLFPSTLSSRRLIEEYLVRHSFYTTLLFVVFVQDQKVILRKILKKINHFFHNRKKSSPCARFQSNTTGTSEEPSTFSSCLRSLCSA